MYSLEGYYNCSLIEDAKITCYKAELLSSNYYISNITHDDQTFNFLAVLFSLVISLILLYILFNKGVNS